MADIIHRIGIQGDVENVYAALSTVDGLSGWWTTQTCGDTNVGGVIQFRFGESGPDMEVVESVPNQRVVWRCLSGPEEWIGTLLSFEIVERDGENIVLFGHKNWKEPVEFMAHCSSKWAYFLFSLKSLVEDGKGTPAPEDRRLSSWG